MAPKKAAPAPAGQPTIGAAFARKSGEHAAGGASNAGASPVAAAAPPLVLVRRQGGVAEYSDFAVNNIKDEGSKANTKAPESDVVEAEARFVESMTDMLHAQPEQAPPQSLVARLLAVLMRPRTPPAPAVAAAAFQALMRLHQLHPSTWVEELPPTAALPVRLVHNPRGWAPVDAAERARCSGGAAADPEAAKAKGIDSDKAAFLHVIAAAAAGGGALGPGPLTPDAAALCSGARLALIHLAAELSDDSAARLRVYNAVATSAGFGAAQRRDALYTLVHTAHLWRLFYMAGRPEQSTVVENLVALLAAGAAPHPTGRGEDAAAAAAAEREAAAAAGEDVDAMDQAAAARAGEEVELEPAGPEASQSPRAATQDASQGERATPVPKKRKAVGWASGCAGGPGFTPPPSAKKQNRRLMAEAEATEARAMQLAAAEGFPTPADAAAAAARIIGALLSLTSAAEACAGSGSEGGAARPGKATSTTLAMGVAYRTELDASLVSACAPAWKALRAMTRGLPGGVGVGPLASLLASTPMPLDAVRLACKAVAHAARIDDAGARELLELGAHGGPEFLKYVAKLCPDVVRGQRYSGCCPTPEAAVDQVAFMVAHVVQACVSEPMPAAARQLVGEHARRASAALRFEAEPSGLGADAAGALGVADAALTLWLAGPAV